MNISVNCVAYGRAVASYLLTYIRYNNPDCKNAFTDDGATRKGDILMLNLRHFRVFTVTNFYQALEHTKDENRLKKSPETVKNGPTPASFLFIFGLFKKTIQFYKKSMRKMSIQYMAPGFEPTAFRT